MRSEESLASLEYHLVVYPKEFVYEEPSAICAQFGAVSILEDPVALLKGDAFVSNLRSGLPALLSGQRVVVKLDVAVGHSADADDA